MRLLSIDAVFVTLLGYPMSFIEFFGTILYLGSVWLIARRNILTWPVGILSVVLFLAIFYQLRLYSDALEQCYYLGACVYGWWYWTRARDASDARIDVGFSRPAAQCSWLVATLSLGLLLGAVMSRIHEWSPWLFPEAASLAYLDAITTVMSFTAMWLMARRRVESWMYWIVVDVTGIGLYAAKDVRFIALLYLILLAMAIHGLRQWWKAARPPSP